MPCGNRLGVEIINTVRMRELFTTYTRRKISVRQRGGSDVEEISVGDGEAHRIVMLESHLTRLCDIRLDISNLYVV